LRPSTRQALLDEIDAEELRGHYAIAAQLIEDLERIDEYGW
jgi:hypothetical protein